MKYLLDTSVWLRSALCEHTLPESIALILRDRDERLGLSVFSLWEVAKKHQRGKLSLPMPLGPWFLAAIPHQVNLLSLTPEIIIDSASLPDFPVKDPADELIVATARVHNLTLLTTDTKLKGYREVRVRYFSPLSP